MYDSPSALVLPLGGCALLLFNHAAVSRPGTGTLISPDYECPWLPGSGTRSPSQSSAMNGHTESGFAGCTSGAGLNLDFFDLASDSTESFLPHFGG